MNFSYHWLKLYYKNESDIADNGLIKMFNTLIILSDGKDQRKIVFTFPSKEADRPVQWSIVKRMPY